MLPYGRQSINEQDIAAVVDVLRSDWLTTGPSVAAFEEQFANYVGAKHAIAVSNGTAALHLAMLVAGIGPGDRVLTSPNTFLASANCAAFVGATPDFCDIDPDSYNICPDALRRTWQEDVRAVVAVDYAGQACEMPAIAEIARTRGAIVVEDACHAVGGAFTHNDRVWKLGGHPWADITTFSFHPVKTLTTGEGGMLVTDNDEYADRARLLRSHGMIRDKDRFAGLGGSSSLNEQGSWYYEMQELGFNYRITDIQCALGISQLQRLDEFTERRREIVRRYNEAFADVDFLTTPKLRNANDRDFISWHLYTVLIDFDLLYRSRSQLTNELRERGIGTQVLYIPVHLQPWYRKTYGFQAGKCPVAEGYYKQALSLPLFAAMSDRDVETVVQAVCSVLKDAGPRAMENTTSFNGTAAVRNAVAD